MGNQHSSSSSSIDIDRLRPFARNVGTLGLNRNELDKRCQPSGLYGTCQWDDKAIRRLIADGRIAARVKGEERPDSSSGPMEECPICFLSYSDVNITKCCNASICTECFLQVRPQKEKQSTCPFCNCNDLSVVCVIAKKKSDNFDSGVPGAISSSSSSLTTTSLSASSGSSDNISSGTGKKKSAASVAPHQPSTKTNGFGSELEKDERYKKLKKRSESITSDDGTNTPKKEKEIIESIAMTSEERQRLEEEMRAQHYHPLVLQLEAEAQERRLENDRAYRRSTGGSGSGSGSGGSGSSSSSSSNSRTQRATDLFRNHSVNIGSGTNTGNSRRMRVRDGASASASTRNWNQLASFYDQGADIDDMVALETAIMFSMGEEERRSTSSSSSNDGGEDSDQNRTQENDNSNNTNNTREQQGGFPLLRSFLTGQLDNNSGSATATASDSTAAGRNSSSSRRHRNQIMRSSLETLSTRHRGIGDVALDTASLMMRGISEEEQISMAIAASMQDHQSDNNGNNNEASGGGDDDDAGAGSSSSSSSSSSENNSNAASSSDSDSSAVVVGAELHPDSVEDSSSSSSPIAQIAEPLSQQQQLKQQQGSLDEASTITELARVVTDSGAPNADTILNERITA